MIVLTNYMCCLFRLVPHPNSSSRYWMNPAKWTVDAFLVQNSHKKIWVGAFWHGSVASLEATIFFWLGLISHTSQTWRVIMKKKSYHWERTWHSSRFWCDEWGSLETLQRVYTPSLVSLPKAEVYMFNKHDQMWNEFTLQEV